MNLTEKLTGVVRTISGKIRADEDVPKSESVTIFLDIDFSDCTTEDVLQFALADRKIAWASGGGGRKAIGKLESGQHIAVKASSPGRIPPVDPKEQLRQEIKDMTEEQALEYLKAKVMELKK